MNVKMCKKVRDIVFGLQISDRALILLFLMLDSKKI